MTIADFPALNATLNGVSTFLLFGGWLFIRAGQRTAHIVCMVLALITSAAFLSCYLIFHATYGSIHFTDPHPIRYFYYVLLFTHVLLAFVSLPLIIMTVVPAIQSRFDRHKRIARRTLPIWLYVSITGVIVYLMNYQWYPSQEIETKLRKKVLEISIRAN